MQININLDRKSGSIEIQITPFHDNLRAFHQSMYTNFSGKTDDIRDQISTIPIQTFLINPGCTQQHVER